MKAESRNIEELQIKEIHAKSIITKSGLPDTDYVINPYVGCMHSCIYCYASFMKRFTNHRERWGHFVDIKVNAAELISADKKPYRGKTIVLSSVTDPYHPIDRKYELTRKILTALASKEAEISILTKSDLVIRDIDVVKKIKRASVAFSISTLDESIAKKTEPLASTPAKRVAALKELHDKGIYTVVFISPMLPYLTDWKKIIEVTKQYTDEYWFENLNMYAQTRENILAFLKEFKPELIPSYGNLDNYWKKTGAEIDSFCKNSKLKYSVYFHH